jgi:hypothetical protein
MANIIGETFAPFVDEQIKVRQEKLGSTIYDNDIISYTTSKDSFIRLTSAVDIDQSVIDKLPNTPNNLIGNKLAENYVLFGGANNVSDSSKPKGGIVKTYTDSILANASYGFDSTAEYGLTPLPGVTSFNIKPKNNGSIVEGEIKIKCYNIQQFNHIEALYLRLGYTLLLEWGHTVYFTNQGALESDITSGINVYKDFLKVKCGEESDPQTYILDQIKQAREDSAGNYDAMLGRVLNYDWSVNPQGEYDITVKVLSPGSVIESLSISVALPQAINGKDTSDESGKKNNLETTTIGKMLSGFKDTLNDDRTAFGNFFRSGGTITDLGELKEDRDISNVNFYFFLESLTNDRIKNFANSPDLIPYADDVAEANSPPPPSSNFQLFTPKLSFPPPKKELLRIDPSGINSEDQYYIKFGALLRIIQNFLLIYNPKNNNSPILNIDWKYENNKCYIPVTNLFSSNPMVCLIPSNFISKLPDGVRVRTGGRKDFDFGKLNRILGTDFLGDRNKKNEFNYMHIHLNIDLLYTILEANINNEGDLALIDFLLSLCTQLNSSLSGLTEFTPFVDTDTNTLSIINKRNSDAIIENPKDPSKFQIGFLHSGGPGSVGIKGGSFVTKVSVNSTIPPDMAKIISIGAQDKNNSNDPDALGFSAWNRGYTDRIVPEKEQASPPKKDEQDAAKAEKEEDENNIQNTRYAGYYSAEKFKYNDDLTKLEADVNKYFKKDAINQVNKGNASSPLLIPISLSLTLDGLSGMKIFQKYTITDEFLPQSYRDNIEFIIKGLNHTIDESGWVTNIEGQFMPKSKITSSSTGDNSSSNDVSPKTEALNQLSNEFTGETPNADDLRTVLEGLGYEEKENQITSNSDITIDMASYAKQVFKKIKELYPSLSIRVTGGNDTFHAKPGSLSRHPKGRGLDFVITPATDADIINVETILKGFAAGNQGIARYQNEYFYPSKNSSGNHFHLSWGLGTEGQKYVNEAIALAKAGTIQTYTV